MKKLITLFALLLAAFALVACGSDSSTTETGVAGAVEEAGDKAEEAGEEAGDKAEEAGEDIEDKADEVQKDAEGDSAGSAASFDVEADPSTLAFTSDKASAKAGNVTVNFTNPSSIPHDVRIEDKGGKDIGGTEVISESNESAKVELEPGSYTFFCSVPGHRQAGMEGTLTVK